MRKITLNILIALISFSFLNFANSEDKKSDNSDNTELNFTTGPAPAGLGMGRSGRRGYGAIRQHEENRQGR